ncbi:MAG TPA: hypothetical protein PKD00_00465 [Burkholderiales bacterium]|nr:hypothetical protein [Burkholderiales bacterium]
MDEDFLLSISGDTIPDYPAAGPMQINSVPIVEPTTDSAPVTSKSGNQEGLVGESKPFTFSDRMSEIGSNIFPALGRELIGGIVDFGGALNPGAQIESYMKTGEFIPAVTQSGKAQMNVVGAFGEGVVTTIGNIMGITQDGLEYLNVIDGTEEEKNNLDKVFSNFIINEGQDFRENMSESASALVGGTTPELQEERKNESVAVMLTRPEFWTEQGAQGAGSMASFFAPSMFLGKAVSALARVSMGLSKFGRVASYAGGAITSATAMSTIEAGMESSGMYKKQYEDVFVKEFDKITKASPGIDPAEAEKQAHAKALVSASNAASYVASANVALLVPTNLLETLLLFSPFKGTTKAVGTVLWNTASESFQEGMQGGIEKNAEDKFEYGNEKELGGAWNRNISEPFFTMTDALKEGDKDAWSSVIIGGVMGGGSSSISEFQEHSKYRALKERLGNALSSELDYKGLIRTFEDLFEYETTTENGVESRKIKVDGKGEPMLNVAKVKEHFQTLDELSKLISEADVTEDSVLKSLLQQEILSKALFAELQSGTDPSSILELFDETASKVGNKGNVEYGGEIISKKDFNEKRRQQLEDSMEDWRKAKFTGKTYNMTGREVFSLFDNMAKTTVLNRELERLEKLKKDINPGDDNLYTRALNDNIAKVNVALEKLKQSHVKITSPEGIAFRKTETEIAKDFNIVLDIIDRLYKKGNVTTNDTKNLSKLIEDLNTKVSDLISKEENEERKVILQDLKNTIEKSLNDTAQELKENTFASKIKEDTDTRKEILDTANSLLGQDLTYEEVETQFKEKYKDKPEYSPLVDEYLKQLKEKKEAQRLRKEADEAEEIANPGKKAKEEARRSVGQVISETATSIRRTHIGNNAIEKAALKVLKDWGYDEKFVAANDFIEFEEVFTAPNGTEKTSPARLQIHNENAFSITTSQGVFFYNGNGKLEAVSTNSNVAELKAEFGDDILNKISELSGITLENLENPKILKKSVVENQSIFYLVTDNKHLSIYKTGFRLHDYADNSVKVIDFETKEVSTSTEEEKGNEESNVGEDIEKFANRIKNGETMTSPEDLQFYANNTTEIEALLKKQSTENKVESTKEDIEKRRQEELNNRSITERNTDGKWDVAAEYLLNSGTNSVLSTDYYLLGVAGAFSKLTGIIDDIRNKYARELADNNLVDLSNAINSNLFNTINSEIRNEIEKIYGKEGALLFDIISKSPKGLTGRVGNEVSSKIDNLEDKINREINAKYDAELKEAEALLKEQSTENKSEQTAIEKEEKSTEINDLSIEVTSEKYSSKLLKDNPDKLFVFGDNVKRTGKGGQAVIRDEPNSIGIATKLEPNNGKNAFMSDDNLEQNKAVIDEDIKKIKEKASLEGKTIVFPKGGLGTGLASLKWKAPQTFEYLNQRLKEEFRFNNTSGGIITVAREAKEGLKKADEVQQIVAEMAEEKATEKEEAVSNSEITVKEDTDITLTSAAENLYMDDKSFWSEFQAFLPEENIAYLSVEGDRTSTGFAEVVTEVPKYPLNIQPDKLLPGTVITLKIPDNYNDVPVKEGAETSTFGDLSKRRGPEWTKENMPIGIYYGDTLIGYLHVPTWVSDRASEDNRVEALKKLNSLRGKFLAKGGVPIPGMKLATTITKKNDGIANTLGKSQELLTVHEAMHKTSKVTAFMVAPNRDGFRFYGKNQEEVLGKNASILIPYSLQTQDKNKNMPVVLIRITDGVVDGVTFPRWRVLPITKLKQGPLVNSPLHTLMIETLKRFFRNYIESSELSEIKNVEDFGEFLKFFLPEHSIAGDRSLREEIKRIENEEGLSAADRLEMIRQVLAPYSHPNNLTFSIVNNDIYFTKGNNSKLGSSDSTIIKISPSFFENMGNSAELNSMYTKLMGILEEEFNSIQEFNVNKSAFEKGKKMPLLESIDAEKSTQRDYSEIVDQLHQTIFKSTAFVNEENETIHSVIIQPIIQFDMNAVLTPSVEVTVTEDNTTLSFEQLKEKYIEGLLPKVVELSEDEKTYVEANPKEGQIPEVFMRVSTFKSKRDAFNLEALPDRGLTRQQARGTAIDTLFRDLFEGKVDVDNRTEVETAFHSYIALEFRGLSIPTIKDSLIDDLIGIFKSIKKSLDEKGLVYSANTNSLYGRIDGELIAGTADIIAYDPKTGTYYILDFKTSSRSRPKDYTNTRGIYKQSDLIQLNIYRSLLAEILNIPQEKILLGVFPVYIGEDERYINSATLVETTNDLMPGVLTVSTENTIEQILGLDTTVEDTPEIDTATLMEDVVPSDVNIDPQDTAENVEVPTESETLETIPSLEPEVSDIEWNELNTDIYNIFQGLDVSGIVENIAELTYEQLASIPGEFSEKVDYIYKIASSEGPPTQDISLPSLQHLSTPKTDALRKKFEKDNNYISDLDVNDFQEVIYDVHHFVLSKMLVEGEEKMEFLPAFKLYMKQLKAGAEITDKEKKEKIKKILKSIQETGTRIYSAKGVYKSKVQRLSNLTRSLMTLLGVNEQKLAEVLKSSDFSSYNVVQRNQLEHYKVLQSEIALVKTDIETHEKTIATYIERLKDLGYEYSLRVTHVLKNLNTIQFIVKRMISDVDKQLKAEEEENDVYDVEGEQIDGIDENSAATEGGMDETDDSGHTWDQGVGEKSLRISMPKYLRMNLSGIKRMEEKETEDGTTIVNAKNFLNKDSIVSPEEVYYTLKTLLSGTSNSLEEILSILGKYSTTYLWLPQVITMLETNKKFATQFASSMPSHALNMTGVSVQKNKTKSGTTYSIKVYNSNSNDAVKSTKEKWMYEAARSKVFYVKDGQLVVDKNRLFETIQGLKNIANTIQGGGVSSSIPSLSASGTDFTKIIKKTSVGTKSIKSLTTDGINNNIEVTVNDLETYFGLTKNSSLRLATKDTIPFESITEQGVQFSISYNVLVNNTNVEKKQVITLKKSGDKFLFSSKPVSEKTSVQISELSELLSNVGISMSYRALEKIVNKGISSGRYTNNILKLFTDNNGVFNILIQELDKIYKGLPSNTSSTTAPIELSVVDSFIEQTFATTLAKEHIEHSPSLEVITSNFRESRKAIHTHVLRKMITDRIMYLKEELEKDVDKRQLINQIKHSIFSSDSLYMDLLLEETEETVLLDFKDKFGIDHLSLNVLKQTLKDYYNTKKLKDLTPIEQEIVELAYYTSNNVDSKKISSGSLKGKTVRIASYLVPKMSDKDTELATQGIAYVFKSGNSDFSTKEEDVNQAYTLYVERVIVPEIKRILHTNRSKLNFNSKYLLGGKVFNNTPILNALSIKGISFLNILKRASEDRTKTIDELTKEIVELYSSELRAAAKKIITTETVRRLQLWEKGKLLDIDESGKITGIRFLDESYLYRVKDQRGHRETAERIAFEYTVNSLINSSEQQMLFIGDLADKFDLKNSGLKAKLVSAINGESILTDAEASLISKSIYSVSAGKRLADLIAPGTKAAESEKNYFYYMPIKDIIGMSSSIEVITQYLDGKKYNEEEHKQQGSDYLKNFPNSAAFFNMETTDGFEFGTWREGIYIRMQEGLLSNEEANVLTEAIANKVSWKDFNEEEKKLAGILLNKVHQPDKPVYTGLVYENVEGEDYGVFREVYVKSSIAYLIPQLTSGMTLDPLRIFMEKLEDNLLDKTTTSEFFGSGGVRVPFSSAVKLGQKNETLEVFDENANVRQDLLSLIDSPEKLEAFKEKYLIQVPRTHLRRQQEVPYKSKKKDSSKNLRGSQEAKFIFADLLSINRITNKYDVEIPFEFRGAQYNPKQLYDIYLDTYKKIYEEQFQALLNEELKIDTYPTLEEALSLLDEAKIDTKDIVTLYDAVKALKSNNISFYKHVDLADSVSKDISPLMNLLRAEAESRQGYSLTARNILKFNGKSIMDLNYPLWASSHSDKFEALLNAVVSNRVYKIIFPGYSYVLTPDILGKKLTNVEATKEVLDKYADKIIWTKPEYAKQQNIKGHDIVNGKVQLDQVIVPSKFVGNDGMIIDLFEGIEEGVGNNWVKFEGGKMILRTENLPKELLNLFGFRIPTSGLMSMAGIEIVGFLHYSVGDIVIAPREFIARMGSDFDIDKLYSYMKNHYYDAATKSLKTFSSADEYVNYHLEIFKSNLLEKQKAKIEKTIRYQNQQTKGGLSEEDIEEETEDNFKIYTETELDVVLEKAKLKFYNEYYKGTLKDKIFDIHLSVMKNPDPIVFKNIMFPLTTKIAEDSATLIYDESNKNIPTVIAVGNKEYQVYDAFTPLSSLFQISERTAANAFKTGVGIKALNSTFHVSIQQAIAKSNRQINLLVEEKDDVVSLVTSMFGIVSNGELGRSRTLGVSPDGVTVADGEHFISFVNSEEVQTMVDGKKLDISGRVNDTHLTFAYRRALTLLGFYTVKLDNGKVVRIGDLVSMQPVIREFINRVSGLRGQLTDFVSNDVKVVIQELMDELTLAPSEALKEQGSQDRMFEALPKSFSDILKNGLDAEKAFQAEILKHFETLNAIGNKLGKVQLVANSDSKVLDKSIFTNIEKADEVADLLNPVIYGGKKMYVDNISSIIGEFHVDRKPELMTVEQKLNSLNSQGKQYYFFKTIRGVEKGKEITANIYINPYTLNGLATVFSLGTGVNIFSSLFPYQGEQFERTLQQFKSLRTSDESVNAKALFRRFLWREMTKHLILNSKVQKIFPNNSELSEISSTFSYKESPDPNIIRQNAYGYDISDSSKELNSVFSIFKAYLNTTNQGAINMATLFQFYLKGYSSITSYSEADASYIDTPSKIMNQSFGISENTAENLLNPNSGVTAILVNKGQEITSEYVYVVGTNKELIRAKVVKKEEVSNDEAEMASQAKKLGLKSVVPVKDKYDVLVVSDPKVIPSGMLDRTRFLSVDDVTNNTTFQNGNTIIKYNDAAIGIQRLLYNLVVNEDDLKTFRINSGQATANGTEETDVLLQKMYDIVNRGADKSLADRLSFKIDGVFVSPSTAGRNDLHKALIRLYGIQKFLNPEYTPDNTFVRLFGLENSEENVKKVKAEIRRITGLNIDFRTTPQTPIPNFTFQGNLWRAGLNKKAISGGGNITSLSIKKAITNGLRVLPYSSLKANLSGNTQYEVLGFTTINVDGVLYKVEPLSNSMYTLDEIEQATNLTKRAILGNNYTPESTPDKTLADLLKSWKDREQVFKITPFNLEEEYFNLWDKWVKSNEDNLTKLEALKNELKLETGGYRYISDRLHSKKDVNTGRIITKLLNTYFPQGDEKLGILSADYTTEEEIANAAFGVIEFQQRKENLASGTVRDNKYIFLRSQLPDNISEEVMKRDESKVKGGYYFDLEIVGDYYSYDKILAEDGKGVDIIIVDTVEQAHQQHNAYVRVSPHGTRQFSVNNKISNYEFVDSAIDEHRKIMFIDDYGNDTYNTYTSENQEQYDTKVILSGSTEHKKLINDYAIFKTGIVEVSIGGVTELIYILPVTGKMQEDVEALSTLYSTVESFGDKTFLFKFDSITPSTVKGVNSDYVFNLLSSLPFKSNMLYPYDESSRMRNTTIEDVNGAEVTFTEVLTPLNVEEGEVKNVKLTEKYITPNVDVVVEPFVAGHLIKNTTSKNVRVNPIFPINFVQTITEEVNGKKIYRKIFRPIEGTLKEHLVKVAEETAVKIVNSNKGSKNITLGIVSKGISEMLEEIVTHEGSKLNTFEFDGKTLQSHMDDIMDVFIEAMVNHLKTSGVSVSSAIVLAQTGFSESSVKALTKHFKTSIPVTVIGSAFYEHLVESKSRDKNRNKQFFKKRFGINPVYKSKSFTSYFKELLDSNSPIVRKYPLLQERGRWSFDMHTNGKESLILWNNTIKSEKEDFFALSFMNMIVDTNVVTTINDLGEEVPLLFNDEVLTVQRLAMYLVLSSMLKSGATQGAKEYSSYIPPAYLKEMGISDELLKIDFSDPKILGKVTNGVTEFVRKFIQTYPKYAKRIPVESDGSFPALTQANTKTLTGLKTFGVTAEQLETTFNVKSFSGPPKFMSVYNPEKSEWLLFEQVEGSSDQQIVTYEKIENFAKKKIAMYNSDLNTRKKGMFVQAKKAKNLHSYGIDLVNNQVNYKILIDQLHFGSTNAYFKTQAEYLRAKNLVVEFEVLNDIKTEDGRTIEAQAVRKGGIYTIQLNKVVFDNLNRSGQFEEIERILLHELGHIDDLLSLQSYINLNTDGTTSIKTTGSGSRKKGQEALKELEAIMLELKIEAKRNPNLMAVLKRKHLDNIYEFMTELRTDKEFQAVLAGIKRTKAISYLDAIVNALVKALAAIKSVLNGYPIEQNSMLYQSMYYLEVLRTVSAPSKKNENVVFKRVDAAGTVYYVTYINQDNSAVPIKITTENGQEVTLLPNEKLSDFIVRNNLVEHIEKAPVQRTLSQPAFSNSSTIIDTFGINASNPKDVVTERVVILIGYTPEEISAIKAKRVTHFNTYKDDLFFESFSMSKEEFLEKSLILIDYAGGYNHKFSENFETEVAYIGVKANHKVNDLELGAIEGVFSPSDSILTSLASGVMQVSDYLRTLSKINVELFRNLVASGVINKTECK